MYDKHNLQSLFEFIWPCLESSSNLLSLNFKRIAKDKKGKKQQHQVLSISAQVLFPRAEAQLTEIF
jgi:hypothetical protein